MGYNLNGEHFDNDSTNTVDFTSVSINEDSDFNEDVLSDDKTMKEGLPIRTIGGILISVFLSIVLICLCIRYFQVKDMEEHGETLTYSFSNFDTNCIFNETEYTPSTKIMLEGLESFYSATYIQPYIVILDYDTKFDDEAVRKSELQQYQAKAEGKNNTMFCLYLVDKNSVKFDKVTVVGTGVDLDNIETDLKSEAERLVQGGQMTLAETVKYSFQSLKQHGTYKDTGVFNPTPSADEPVETNPVLAVVSIIAVGIAVIFIIRDGIHQLLGIDVAHDVKYKNPHSGYYKDSPWAIRQRDVERYMNSHSTKRRRW